MPDEQLIEAQLFLPAYRFNTGLVVWMTDTHQKVGFKVKRREETETVRIHLLPVYPGLIQLIFSEIKFKQLKGTCFNTEFTRNTKLR